VNAQLPPALLELGPRFVARVAPGGRVLDVGCGPGRDIVWLTQHGLHVVGGDLSAGMLAQARRQTAAPLVRLDMCRLPFADGVFGGVWSSASLLHLPKRDAPTALAEIRRVLATGGPLLLSIQEGQGEGWELSPYGPVERFFARYRPEEAETLLAEAGFLVEQRYSSETPNRRWLDYLAVRQGSSVGG
jgi:SAM-dependent methyltransferase